MYSRFKFLLTLLIFLTIACPALADGGGGEGGGNQQSLVHAIVQIAISAIILKILSVYKLP
jgi:hypothetical protein